MAVGEDEGGGLGVGKVGGSRENKVAGVGQVEVGGTAPSLLVLHIHKTT